MDSYAENSFGLKLSNGLHLVGESSGKDYDLSGAHGVMIGSLYSEIDFLIEGRHFIKGLYLLQAIPQHLTIWQTGSDYGGKTEFFIYLQKAMRTFLARLKDLDSP